MKKILILILLLLFLPSCTKNTSNTELKDILKENNYLIVDVRTKEEYEISHIKNALNIPYNELDNTINLAKDKYILVYCKSGKRSKIAYTKLKELGYKTFDLGSIDNLNFEKE